jgi:hypothetical protein
MSSQSERSLKGLVINPDTKHVPSLFLFVKPDLGEYNKLGIPRPIALDEVPTMSLIDWVAERRDKLASDGSIKLHWDRMLDRGLLMPGYPTEYKPNDYEMYVLLTRYYQTLRRLSSSSAWITEKERDSLHWQYEKMLTKLGEWNNGMSKTRELVNPSRRKENERAKEYTESFLMRHLVSNLIQVNPYLQNLGIIASLHMGDDSYGGLGWEYPAFSIENIACQVLGQGVGEDDNVTVQLLLPTLDLLKRNPEVTKNLKAQGVMDMVRRRVIDVTVPLARLAIPRTLEREGVVVNKPNEICLTRFVKILDYSDTRNPGLQPEYINREDELENVYPSGDFGNNKGSFVRIDAEYAF